jgi:glycosyltransferase involved in cell wall biosynthesis
MEEEALQCHIPRESVHYLPNGVDLKRFRPPHPQERCRIKSEEGWPKDRLVCLYAGRLSAEKGILELLDAWRSVDKRHAILVLVGPDMPGHSMNAGPAARKFVAEQKMEDRIIFYGPSENVPRLLRGADIFIQPSHYEAFGISVIEAMATGLPVIATRVGGMIDYLVDGVNAVLCEPLAPDDLASQIRRLLDDAPLRKRLGKDARETVACDFNEAVIFERLTTLFTETALRT